MAIQHLYNLPSCVVEIEGISGEGTEQKLSILTGFSCRFFHNGMAIAGGRELVDDLVSAVGSYAQAQMTEAIAIENSLVSLTPQGTHLHRLKIKPSFDQPALDLILSTVELFDLVEALDTLCLDPKNDLNLTPAIILSSPKRKPSFNFMPMVIGFGTLAIATSLLVIIPTPEPQKPEPAIPSLNENRSN